MHSDNWGLVVYMWRCRRKPASPLRYFIRRQLPCLHRVELFVAWRRVCFDVCCGITPGHRRSHTLTQRGWATSSNFPTWNSDFRGRFFLDDVVDWELNARQHQSWDKAPDIQNTWRVIKHMNSNLLIQAFSVVFCSRLCSTQCLKNVRARAQASGPPAINCLLIT